MAKTETVEYLDSKKGEVTLPYLECVVCQEFKEANAHVTQWKIGNSPDDQKQTHIIIYISSNTKTIINIKTLYEIHAHKVTQLCWLQSLATHVRV